MIFLLKFTFLLKKNSLGKVGLKLESKF